MARLPNFMIAATMMIAATTAPASSASAATRPASPPPIPAHPATATADHGGALMTDAELREQIAIMKAELKPETYLLWRPVLTADRSTAALEYWHRPRPPAAHIAEAEYVTVMGGSGWMLSGGTLSQAHETRPGLLEGDEIQGGTRRELKPGDVFLIPAGMPHWFGIHGESLILLGIKLPVAKKD